MGVVQSGASATAASYMALAVGPVVIQNANRGAPK